MLRIVGVQRSENPQHEFVLLQNQGHMRVLLKGHMILSESVYNDPRLEPYLHLFTDDQYISPGLFVLLTTGHGEPHWSKTRDGAHVYRTFMGREVPVWETARCPIHVLAAQHSFVQRGDSVFALR